MIATQAIQIRYLPPTNFLPARLKASTYAGTLIKTLSNEKDIADQAYEFALQLAKSFDWEIKNIGFGVLPNGDYVITNN